MVYALDPRIHRVWRTPDVLQFGIDRIRLLLDGVSTAEERMLAALDAGVTLPGLALSAGKGVRPDDVQRFLDRIAPVLAPARRAANPRRIVIDGAGATAALLLAILRDEGADVRSALRWDDPFVDAADAAVIVGGFALAPERHRPWLQRDIPHLPVVFGDEAVRIGPFVRPGIGPCLVCIDLHRADEDADWPAIASQLHTRQPRRESRLVSALAASAAAHALLAALDACPDERPGWATSVSVHYASGRPSERDWSAHPRCGCLGLSRATPAGTTSPGTTATG